jgi:hypothetical protein
VNIPALRQLMAPQSTAGPCSNITSSVSPLTETGTLLKLTMNVARGDRKRSTRSSSFISTLVECARTQLCGCVPRHLPHRGMPTAPHQPNHGSVQREGLRRVQHGVEHGTLYTWFINIPLCIIQLQWWGAIPTAPTPPRHLSRPKPPRPPRPPPAAPTRCEG